MREKRTKNIGNYIRQQRKCAELTVVWCLIDTLFCSKSNETWHTTSTMYLKVIYQVLGK